MCVAASGRPQAIPPLCAVHVPFFRCTVCGVCFSVRRAGFSESSGTFERPSEIWATHPWTGPEHGFSFSRGVVKKRWHIEVCGCVQGVGFRPTVYRHASACGLTGYVLNALSGVVIEVEGASDALERFLHLLKAHPPPQARIDSIAVREIPPVGDSEFVIRRSKRSGDVAAGMPPDLAVCADCERELFDPHDRRYRYPFINCTNCGPRFTIIRGLPYDRARTSMAVFPMCPQCEKEYNDPLDRRFDAQPNACPVCGPRLILRGPDGTELDGDPLKEIVRRIRVGETVAVKGLGGFHLACLATDDEAVARLRHDKSRPHKALAVMFASLDEIAAHCEVSDAERDLLLSPARPIVILARRLGSTLSPLISPDTDDVGAFLPYTPLHLLLLREVSPLVMTSANRAEEPIAHRFEDLQGGLLGRAASVALDHDREIVRRCDDSVVRVVRGRPLPIRRSRGFVPAPIRLPLGGPSVLACGAELKNVFCMTRGRDAFLSQHVGDLVEWTACRFYEEAVHDLIRLLETTPVLAVHDLHPDYVSTRFAQAYADAPCLGVQHHHAHIASCMAENGWTEPVIGVALDGTGYGPDGTIWGGEFLVTNLVGYRRLARFEPAPLPGGDAAVRHPVRMAWSVLVQVFGETEADGIAARLLPRLDSGRRRVLSRVLRMRERSPLTSSAGRIFDAVAALMELCDVITYEGQAAIRLQRAAERFRRRPPPLKVELRRDKDDGPWDVSFAPVVRELVRRRLRGGDVDELAAIFHSSVADAVASVCRAIREAVGLDTVALSGGVFQNALLFEWTTDLLESDGFRVLVHTRTPPNDAGVALGQAAVGLAHVTDREELDRGRCA